VNFSQGPVREFGEIHVIKEVYATYSPRPGIDAYPPSKPLHGLAFFLPVTGPPRMPATMEGASAADI